MKTTKHLFYSITLLLIFAGATLAQTPVIESISPSAVSAGGPSFTLTVKGSGFKKAKVKWNGSTLVTTRLSPSTLAAVVPASLIVTPGTAQITVVRKQAVSNSLLLTIGDSASSGYDWSELRRRLRSLVPATVRGVGLMISHRGQIVFSEAYGNQTTDSVLPIASSTKMPSATLIMSLVDEGSIDLDEPVATYLQGKIDWPADKSSITMRMLFNHTSGLRPGAPCLSDLQSTLKDCAQEIANTPLEFTPGTNFAYGGSGMQVGGYVAEAVTGRKWNDLFAERVAAPIGLTRFTYTDTNNPIIGGGAFSDMADYTKMLQMHLAGGVTGSSRILSEEIIQEMQRNQVEGIPTFRSPGGEALPGYSFGWWHSAPSEHPESNGPELSDPGAFGCTPWIDLDLNYSAVLLIFKNTQTGTQIWHEIRPLITEQIERNQ